MAFCSIQSRPAGCERRWRYCVIIGKSCHFLQLIWRLLCRCVSIRCGAVDSRTWWFFSQCFGGEKGMQRGLTLSGAQGGVTLWCGLGLTKVTVQRALPRDSLTLVISTVQGFRGRRHLCNQVLGRLITNAGDCNLILCRGHGLKSGFPGLWHGFCMGRFFSWETCMAIRCTP